MKTTCHSGGENLLRTLIAAILLFAIVGAASPAPSIAAQQSERDATLDLPAMAVTTADLAEEGMSGYLFLNGQTVGTGSLAGTASDWNDQRTPDDLRATFEDAGLLKGYEFGLRLRQDPADPGSDTARDLYIDLNEFRDATGAAGTLALLDELSAPFTGVQRVEGSGPVTSGAVLVRPIPEEPEDPEDQTQELSIAFQVDRIIAVIDILDYLDQEPTVEEAETIAARLQQRIEAGLDGDTPGLGNMALRIRSVEFESLYEVRRDEYLRRDGEDLSFAFEYPDEFAKRVAASGDAVDAYAFNQFIQDVEAVDPPLPDQFVWIIRIYRFSDDQAAAAWLDAQPGQIEASFEGTDERVKDLQVVQDGPVFGDESTSLTYTRVSDITSKVFRTFLRVGDRTADIWLSSFASDPFPDTAIEALATVQVQCLTTGCPDPIVITDAFKGEIPVDEPAGEPGVPSGQARPDLAAMTLTPADLDELEMPGYGIGFGQTAYPEDLTASIAENRGLPEEEVRSRLQGAGFVRRYDSQLYLPADETDPTGTFGRTVASYVVQFADEGGAASAWDFLEDESCNSLAGDIPLSTPISDQSEATQENILDSETGEPYIQIDVTFRTGNLHAGVAIIDWEGGLVELPEVEAAAHRLLERVQTGLSGTAPGLDGLTFRLSGEQIIPSADYYTLVAGEAIPQYGESPQDVAARESAAASDGQTEIYSLQQELSTGTEAPDDDTWYLLELTRFTDDDAATRWLGGSQERISGNDALKDAEFVDGPTYGSESVHYTLTTADGQTGHRGISFRVGNIVASIEVAAPTTPLAMFAQALASAQERCLEDGGCPEPVSLSSDTGS